jgi:uncharacterized protein (DUF3084 family)
MAARRVRVGEQVFRLSGQTRGQQDAIEAKNKELAELHEAQRSLDQQILKHVQDRDAKIAQLTHENAALREAAQQAREARHPSPLPPPPSPPSPP